MGQSDAMNFFKKNADSFFPAEDVAQILGINIQSALAILKKLRESKDLDYKEIKLPNQGAIKKLYCYRIKDDYIEEIKHEYKYLRNQREWREWRAEQVLAIIQLREMKILNKRVEHLENLGEAKK